MNISLTRPEFLVMFFDNENEYNMDTLKKIFPETYDLVYCCYDLIQDSNLDKNDIIAADVDKDSKSITIQLHESSLAKKIKKKCDGNIYGNEYFKYNMKIKNKGSFAIIEMIKQ